MKPTAKNIYCFLLAACILVYTAISYAPTSSAKEDLDYDSIIIQTQDTFLRARRPEKILHRAGIKEFKTIKKNVYTLPIDRSKSTEKQLAELRKSNLFKIVEPNYKLAIDKISAKERSYTRILKNTNSVLSTDEANQSIKPNDKGFASQYYLREINAPKAWNITVGDPLLVAVLDTGVDSNHPDLIGKVTGRANHDHLDLTDDIAHGTGVAGVIAAHTNNTEGIAGIAWNTKILSIRITDNYGQARVSDVISALEEVYKKGAKIIQISLSTNQYSETLENAIIEAQSKGILVITTGGNTGTYDTRYPAAFDGVIGAGAVNSQKEVESYSTKGEHIGLVAPGTDIFTTSPYYNYETLTGTSFAAPQIAGAAALVWSLVPELTCFQVRDILYQSADDLGAPGKDEEYGHGLLNAKRAVELAREIQQQNDVTREWIHN